MRPYGLASVNRAMDRFGRKRALIAGGNGRQVRRQHAQVLDHRAVALSGGAMTGRAVRAKELSAPNRCRVLPARPEDGRPTSRRECQRYACAAHPTQQFHGVSSEGSDLREHSTGCGLGGGASHHEWPKANSIATAGTCTPPTWRAGHTKGNGT